MTCETLGQGPTNERGFTLIETMVSLCVLAIVAVGVLPLAVVATKATENQGHLMARTTEYAQDKLEQLLALAWTDTTSDTRVFPATDAGGTGLSLGGSIDPDAPAANYVDYLDIDGNVVTGAGGNPPNNWYYKRVWQVTSPAANLKRVEVLATVRVAALGGSGAVPRSTVAALKTNPF